MEPGGLTTSGAGFVPPAWGIREDPLEKYSLRNLRLPANVCWVINHLQDCSGVGRRLGQEKDRLGRLDKNV